MADAVQGAKPKARLQAPPGIAMLRIACRAMRADEVIE